MNIDILNKYLAKGLSIIPVNDNKTPSIKWGQYQTEFISEKYFHLFNNYIGIVCGEISGNLICIDIDLKYDLSGDLYDRIMRATPPQLYKKLWVQKTLNGGYHWIYRVKEKVNGGNTKLANRPTTSDEKNKTYLLEIGKGRTKEEAYKIAEADKVRVLIETRHEGGYFIGYGKGYRYVGGKLTTLSIPEHEDILSIMRSFNEYFPIINEGKKDVINLEGEVGTHPFDVYNKEGSVHDLLINNGWIYVFEDADRVYYRRPGTTTNLVSANFNKELRLFKVFSTSTSLEANRAYTPASLFTALECNGNISQAVEKLSSMGFGDKDESSQYIKKLAKIIYQLAEAKGITEGTLLEKAKKMLNG